MAKSIEFVAASGKTVVINEAPWQEAKRLKMVAQREMAKIGIDEKTELNAVTLIKLFLMVESSDEVDAALSKCLMRCTRDGVKINDTCWDMEGARGDYYEIVKGCVEINLGPLAESFRSMLGPFMKSLGEKINAIQKSA